MIKKNLIYIIGAVIGAIGGYLYWHFIRCSSGACPITSSPFMSTIWGALLGSTFFGLFKKEKSNK